MSGGTAEREAPTPEAAAAVCGTASTAADLNRTCLCLSTDTAALERTVLEELGDGMHERLRHALPSLFSPTPVFVPAARLRDIEDVIDAVEHVVALPGWTDFALALAPPIARHQPQGAQGVFFGYDFHLDERGVGLIEINTNAGGALLNAALARAQTACCPAVQAMQPSSADVAAFEEAIVGMFRREGTGRERPLRHIAIVDRNPEAQFLYLEFRLFQRLFELHGLRAAIVDPAELTFVEGRLRHDGREVDLVYNRLTDFYLQGDDCAALHEAYLQDAAVVTPNPRNHALYANKQLLVALSDPEVLRNLGAPDAVRDVLARSVPRTEVVSPEAATRLWAERRHLFFKPAAGFGGKAAYRGEKLTQRVWQEIRSGDYVAQAFYPAPERQTNERTMKFDLRAWVYAGRIQWVAARVYHGQTTNFRSPGGGFAAVFRVPDVSPGTAGPSEHHAENHASFVFLLAEGEVHPIPHALYVALSRAEAASESLAGRTLRLADWYVRLNGGKPEALVNESYGLVRFDDQGRLDPSPEGAGDENNAGASWQPTENERKIMARSVFGSEAAADTTANR